METVAPDDPIVVSSFQDAKDAYRQKELRQSLYDEGEVVMADVLVNLHGSEHRSRRRVENRLFRRETFDFYERELFPGVIEQTLEPHLAAGAADLVSLGHHLMLNLAALTAGVDRPEGTAEETERLYSYMMLFIQGATLAHSTGDKDEQRECIFKGLVDWDRDFLEPSMRRRGELLRQAETGSVAEKDVPTDVLTTLMRHQDELGISRDVIRREIAFFLLAGAHTSATAFVRAIDHILDWTAAHPDDAPLVTDDSLFVQRCIHETVRLNPSSPIGRRRAQAPVDLKSGVHIPEGATVVIDLHAVNRDREVFGVDAAEFNPHRVLPQNVAPFGLSFAAGMHVCIGQDLAAGVVPGADVDRSSHLFGLVTGAVQRMFLANVRHVPQRPPQRDSQTARPYWGAYPVLLDRP